MLVKKHKGLSIKDVRTKIDPLLVRKMSALVKRPLPPCPCRHTINFENSGVFAPKSAESASEEPPLPLSTLDKLPPDYGRPLWTLWTGFAIFD